MNKLELVVGGNLRHIIVLMIALAASPVGERSAFAQVLQSGEGVIRNDGVPQTT